MPVYKTQAVTTMAMTMMISKDFQTNFSSWLGRTSVSSQCGFAIQSFARDLNLPKNFSFHSHPGSSFSLPNQLKSKKSSVAASGNANLFENDQLPAKALNDNVLEIIQKANAFLPHVVMASTLLALVFPPSFTWFTNRYYAPALGFLMFAVGINLSPLDFIHAFQRPRVILVGYMGQFVAKPLLGSGIILVSCVSGAQLSNYATFLVEPSMAPISIVMTALSTATAVIVTPALTLLLLGRRLPIDVQGMMVNITQIVVAPIVAGLVINNFAAPISRIIRPFMPLFSVLVTGLCVGSPLATNIKAVRSLFGLAVLFPVLGFHTSAFLSGFHLAGLVFSKAPDAVKIQKTISFETGMQSSLLGLALANKFFTDPLVGLPAAISTVLMSLMGFSLVMYWNTEKAKIRANL